MVFKIVRFLQWVDQDDLNARGLLWSCRCQAIFYASWWRTDDQASHDQGNGIVTVVLRVKISFGNQVHVSKRVIPQSIKIINQSVSSALGKGSMLAMQRLVNNWLTQYCFKRIRFFKFYFVSLRTYSLIGCF